MFLRALLIIGLTLLTSAAEAAPSNGYADPTWPNLVRTLVRFNALSLKERPLIDEYAIITECKLYQNFYQNDFKWEQVRQAVLQSAEMNVATFPTNYHYDVQLQLARYDFDSKTFLFTDKSKLSTINALILYSVEGTGCGHVDVKNMPRIFRAVLSAPLSLEGLPLANMDAQALLKRMEENKNDDRIIHARFNLRIVFIDPLRKTVFAKGGKEQVTYAQANAKSDAVQMDTQLDSIDFYEDPEMTRLIYEYTP